MRSKRVQLNYGGKKPAYGKKYGQARRFASLSVPRSVSLSKAMLWDKKEYNFKRSFLITNNGDDFQYASATGYNPVPLTITLNSLPNYTDFTSLFDKYKITHAEFKFTPHHNVGQVPLGPQSTSIARLITVIDQDDDATPSGLTQLMQYSSLDESLLDKERIRHFKPRPVVQTYRSSTSTGYSAPDSAIWVDAAQTDVPHYCGKALVADTTASPQNPRKLTIMCTVWLTCSGVH